MPVIHWNWWAWGWAAIIGGIILLAILIIPWFFFLLNLHNLLERIKPENRHMPPSHVWLNFIPVFMLGWFIYTVMKVRDSIRDEYQSRGWLVEDDLGYNVGLATGILAIASWVGFPLGPLTGIAWLVCWIIYWLKTSDYRRRFAGEETWRGTPAPPPYSTPPRDYRSGGAYPPAGGYPPPGGYPPSSGYQSGSYPPGGGYPPPPPRAYPPSGGYSPPGGHGTTAGYPPSAAQTPPAEAPPAQAPPAQTAPETAASAARFAPPQGYPAPRGFSVTDDSSPESQQAEQKEREKRCAACGSEYDPKDKFCRACGLPLPRRLSEN